MLVGIIVKSQIPLYEKEARQYVEASFSFYCGQASYEEVADTVKPQQRFLHLVGFFQLATKCKNKYL